MDSTRKNRLGFTLVEMLVVVLIIVILMGLLLPAIQAARENARAAKCINNQLEIAKALINYGLTKNRMPGVLSFASPPSTNDPNPRKINWVMSTFGEMGRMDLWQDWNKPDLGNTPVYGTLVKVSQLLCPSDSFVDPSGGLSYFLNLGAYNPNDSTDFSGRLFRNRTTSPAEPDLTLDSVKSLTRTVMISERAAQPGSTIFWNNTNAGDISFTWPPNINVNDANKPYNSTTYFQSPTIKTFLSSNHRGDIIVTFCDGHTEKIPETTYTWLDPDNPISGTP